MTRWLDLGGEAQPCLSSRTSKPFDKASGRRWNATHPSSFWARTSPSMAAPSRSRRGCLENFRERRRGQPPLSLGPSLRARLLAPSPPRPPRREREISDCPPPPPRLA